MSVELPPLTNSFNSLLLDETFMEFDSSEIVRTQRDLGHSVEAHVKLEGKIRGIVKREREMRIEMRDRENLLRSRLRELENVAAVNEGLKKELWEANSMVEGLQELREREKEDAQNRMTAMEGKHHEELLRELQKKDQHSEAIRAGLLSQKEELDRVWRKQQDQMAGEIVRLQRAAVREKATLRQDLHDKFQLERKNIQEGIEKYKNIEKEAMSETLEEERRCARGLLDGAKKEHSRREEELEDQLQQARQLAMTAETNLQEQLWKEQGLLDQLEQAREQAHKAEAKLQQQLRKELEEREEEKERFRVAIEEEKARVRQGFYNGFFEGFTKEKALLVEGLRKDIQEMREDIKKEVKMKTGEKSEEDILLLSKLKLEEEERTIVGEECDLNVARD